MKIIKNYFKKKSDIRIIKHLKSQGTELIYPFTIHNVNNLKLGKNIYIGPSSWLILRGNLSIGDGTIIGPRLKVHTSNHNYEGDMIPYSNDYIIKDVIIGNYVWVGADVTILPGIKIGDGAIIGACSCVTKNVPDLAIVGGNPAQILKYRDKNNFNKSLKDGKFYQQNKF